MNSQSEREKLRGEIREGFEQIQRGEAIVLRDDEELREFFDDLKKRGRDRYHSGQSQRS